MTIQRLAQNLKQDGFCVLNSVFGAEAIARFRDTTIRNLDQMGQTRAEDHSYHLAGFHRFTTFANMHADLVQAAPITEFLAEFFESERQCAIGLSDITVNRSQHWHTDLLRGPFATYLEGVDPWAQSNKSCIKALVYLQAGKSLRIVRGSHLTPSPLDDDALDRLAQTVDSEQLEINAGDVVMMDIRALHRGSTDIELSDPSLKDDPKILVSTVFGENNSPLCQAMQIGNAHRLVSWDSRHLKD